MDNKRTQFYRQIADMRSERESYIPHWRDLNEFVLPRSARFLITTGDKGNKRNQKIVNNTPTLSARTLASGMMAGVTSPARPWFKLGTGNPELDKSASVKQWLDEVAKRIAEVFGKSNLYNALPMLYADLGVYGTASMAILEDDDTVIRAQPFPIGSYGLANSHRGNVDKFFREFQMTVRQLVQMFGKANCSPQVQRMAERGQWETFIEVSHLVQPNAEYNENRGQSKYKRFASCYMETGTAHGDARASDQFLRESGFDEFPIMAPRWSLTGEDIYGNSPGMDALGDIKALQLKEKRKAQMIDKGVNPPMSAPSSLRNQRASLLPGDVTYVDVNQGQQGFQPVYEPNPTWLNAIVQDIQNDEMRIKRAFFEDLFLMLSQIDRAQITATEIAERKEEKLLVLGPVLDRLNDELLDPLIDRTFSIMYQRSLIDWKAGLPGLIPQPPEELQDITLKVEYTSVMAQALKMVGLSGIERFAGFMGNLAAVDPGVLDKWNRDATVEDYADKIGMAQKNIVSEEDVAAIRAQRAKQQQQMESMAMAGEAAKIGQTMSSTDVSGDNALAKIVQSMSGAGV